MLKHLTHYYPVILAGGLGTRLWPISRAGTPKQISMKLGDKTLLEQTYHNVCKGFPRSSVLVSTNIRAASAVRRLLKGLPSRNLIIEPVMRNTAPAIGLAAVHLLRRDSHAIMVTVNSDAWIQDVPAFHRALSFAHHAVVEKPDHMVFIGINPSYPETGYGYMEMGIPVIKFGDLEAFTLRSFVEKPDLATAKRYLARWRYLWNPTLVTARADHVLELYAQHLPAVAQGLTRIADARGTRKKEADVVRREFARMPSISIDYGIFEKIKKNVLVIPAEFGWADVGNFRTIHEILSHRTRRNVVKGELVEIDADNNLVWTAQKKLITLVGVHNMIMVETEDTILLCHKERAQEVKKVVEILIKRKMAKYL